MEDITYQTLVGATVTEFVIRVLWAVGASLLTMFGFWELRRRIKALENDRSQPAISQTFNFTHDATSGSDDAAKQLREGMESETLSSLRQTIRRLPQEPFGDGNTFADLPDGTRIVSLADGTYRLALPVRIKPVMLEVEIGGATNLSRAHMDNG